MEQCLKGNHFGSLGRTLTIGDRQWRYFDLTALNDPRYGKLKGGEPCSALFTRSDLFGRVKQLILGLLLFSYAAADPNNGQFAA